MEDKYGVLAKLEAGIPAKELATDDLPYAKILRWHREFKAAKLNGDIDKLYDTDKLILEQAALAIEAPKEIQEQLKQSAKELTNGLTGLERLDDGLQVTALAINTKIKSQLNSLDSASELEILTECLCKLRNAFFNQKGAQVAIQQNFGSQDNTASSAYKGFLDD